MCECVRVRVCVCVDVFVGVNVGVWVCVYALKRYLTPHCATHNDVSVPGKHRILLTYCTDKQRSFLNRVQFAHFAIIFAIIKINTAETVRKISVSDQPDRKDAVPLCKHCSFMYRTRCL